MKTLDRYVEGFKWKMKTTLRFFFIFSVFAIMSSVCKAEVDPNVWVEGGSGKDFQQYLYIPDLLNTKKTTRQFEGHKIVNVWLLSMNDDGSSSKSLLQFYLNPDYKQIRSIEWIGYDKDGNISYSGRNNNAQWGRVIPGTVGEINYSIVERWATY